MVRVLSLLSLCLYIKIREFYVLCMRIYRRLERA